MSSLLLAAILMIQGAAAPSSSQRAISVTIKSVSDVVKLGSELRLSIVITNISDNEIEMGIPVGSGPQGEFLDLIDMRDEKGNAAVKTKYYKQIRGEEVVQGGIHLETTDSLLRPGESLTEEVILTKLYNLDKPGKYKIEVQHDDPESKALVKSNTLTVSVTP